MDADSFNIEKTYIYANGQILAQHTGPISAANQYFYLHDRLGSVRLVTDKNGTVKNKYTYGPFGQMLGGDEYSQTVDNPFKFTGQWYDEEIGQYYLRARMYDPYLSRFTTFDPVRGKFQQPLSLHKYLYCLNDPINFVDRDGKWALSVGLSGAFNVNMSHVDPIFRSLLGKTLGRTLHAVSTMMAYYNLILPLYTAAVEHGGFGGTAGGAFVVAHNSQKAINKGWSMGFMGYGAAGVSVATGPGRALMFDIGISPEAQHIKHLRGWFGEAGASVTAPAPFILGFNAFSFTASVSENEEVGLVTLWTYSLGWGTPGVEGHVFGGHTWVSDPIFEN